ncbi:MAG: competence/damage-inducible protein A [Cryomorphaceae bacterium]|nr:MAG: competence/damage-inducible protein A [Cryomorphaceae bacterium]
MRAEIISIGDELLLGQTINTNAAWMGRELHEAGISLQQVVTITDSRDHILSALKECTERADVVLVTGGLGPTRDDITKETLCSFFNTKLVRNEEVLAAIRRYFGEKGIPVLPANEAQADLPEKADILPNPRGTAMGMWFEENNKVVVSMPGVPHEMEGMMREQVLPRLRRLYGNGGFYYEVVQTIGVGESRIAHTIKDWEDRIRSEGLSLAYLPSSGMVRLRVSGPVEMKERVTLEASRLEELLGDIVFARGDYGIAEVLGAMLRERKMTLAVAESCTGGYLSEMITSVSGSSDYYLGGVISYHRMLKSGVLGVDEAVIDAETAVCEKVAVQMADGVRKLTGADVALATTGIAGPDGGTPENPVGTVWIGISSAAGSRAERFTFGRNRSRNIRVASLFALNMLRKHLIAGL